MESYNAAAEQLDDKSLSLEEQISAINSEIKAEQRRPAPGGDDLLRTNIEIDLAAEASGDIEMILTCRDQCASWEARYDVRASVETATVLLVYKALISQCTGKSWDNIPLALETTSPMFGADVGGLTPWMIRVRRNQQIWTGSFPRTSPVAPEMSGMRRSTISMNQNTSNVNEAPPTIAEEVANRFASVTSKGNIFVTFQIPNLITIPSDGTAHNVTIVELALEMLRSWIAVPKKDPRVHLKAKITNTSQLWFPSGDSQYEAFELDLGLDPSVGITYHLRENDFTQIGEYWKQITARRCTQRIAVFNNKAVPVEIKVVDQIPVSEDSSLTVKFVTPELTRPN
ncbi:hypothetical protein BDZ94DRAFT_1320020 [Collybia nuda]|uniref:DUF4139 domain-containing protein n=1 Tax=Collybia nuda TaxID=64659 RepID=A0A9P5YBN6_9AGAR|nr:hypothetical protein BDZ94DRAFT_1320020 [Collybia nuda]